MGLARLFIRLRRPGDLSAACERFQGLNQPVDCLFLGFATLTQQAWPPEGAVTAKEESSVESLDS